MQAWIILAVVVGVALMTRRPLAAWLTMTSTGLANQPDNAAERANLEWMESLVVPQLLAIVRTVDPRFAVTSVYRSDAVNAAVRGSASSLHAKGLAVDFGGLAGATAEQRRSLIIAAAVEVWSARAALPPMHEVIAEWGRNHLHVGMRPPGNADRSFVTLQGRDASDNFYPLTVV